MKKSNKLDMHIAGSTKADKYMRDSYDARFEKMYICITADLIKQEELPIYYPLVTPPDFKEVKRKTDVYVFSLSYLRYSTNVISVMDRINSDGRAKVYKAETKEEFIALIQAYALGGDLRNLFNVV